MKCELCPDAVCYDLGQWSLVGGRMKNMALPNGEDLHFHKPERVKDCEMRVIWLEERREGKHEVVSEQIEPK